MLDKKLNLRDGHTVALVNSPHEIDVRAPQARAEGADAIILFAKDRAELDQHVQDLLAASRRGALLWVAYPKARQLGTDLNRDTLHDHMRTVGLSAVRQVSIDETWSALRFKPLP